ncbi:MAG: selenium cofactor biosynthesis protein YqeC [Lachnospirales bacterium]
MSFNIDKGITAIIGSGGKTTLLKYLGDYYREYRTIVSTTTKLGIRQIDNYDYIQKGEIKDVKKGLNFAYKEVDGKVIGYHGDYFNEIDCDYIFLECDGAKRKLLKGWANHEPVIPEKTNRTISVINIECIGMQLNEEFIHRLEIFKEITGAKETELITFDHILNISKEMARLSIGTKTLYINRCTNYKPRLKEFAKYFNEVYYGDTLTKVIKKIEV